MTTQPLKVGVLGCSEHAREKMRALIEAGAEIIAVADQDSTRLIAAVDVVKSKSNRSPVAYESADALIERVGGLDAVVIVLPSFLHQAFALKALRRGLHVHVENPFTDSLAEAREIHELAAAQGLIVDVGYQKRVCVEQLAAKVGDGLIGRVLHGRATWVRPATDRIDIPRSLWDNRSGGAIVNLGSHLVDTALRFVAAPPRAVMALASNEQGIAIHGEEFVAEDSVHALIGCAGRVTIALDVAWAAHVPRELIRLDLHGTDGRLEVPIPDPPTDPATLRPVLHQDDGKHVLEPLMQNFDAHVEAMGRFIEACRHAPGPDTYRDLDVTRAVLDAVRRSAAADGDQVAVEL